MHIRGGKSNEVVSQRKFTALIKIMDIFLPESDLAFKHVLSQIKKKLYTELS